MPLGGGVVMGGLALASAIGKKRAANKQRQSEDDRITEANRLSGEDHASQLAHNDYIKSLFGEGGQYASMLTDPLTSMSQTSMTHSSETTPTFTAEGQAGISGMLENAMNEQARSESLPEFAGMEEGMARDYGQQMSGLKTALGNRASGRGAAPLDVDLEGILAGRGITADYLGQKQKVPMMREQARMGKGNIANMLFGQVAGLGRGSKTKGRQDSTTHGSQDQGAGAMLGYLNQTRPPERTVYV